MSSIGNIMKSLDMSGAMNKTIGSVASVVAIGYVGKFMNDQGFLKKADGKNDDMMRGIVFLAAGAFLPGLIGKNLGKGMSQEIVNSIGDGFMLVGANLLLKEFAPDLTQGGLSAIGGVENIYDPAAYINAAQRAVSDYINCANCQKVTESVQLLDENGNELFIDHETGMPMQYVYDENPQLPAMELNDCEKYLQR